MSNYAWVLEVRPGYEEEYKKRHDELWPEMKDMLREAGVRNYNIFRHGLTLFGYFETDDLKKSIKHITDSEINKKWGEYMSPIMKIDVDENKDMRSCPKCENGKLGLNIGRYGAYISCSNYPDCKFNRQTANNESSDTEHINDNFVPDNDGVLGVDPETDLKVLIKKGPYGIYLQLGEEKKPKRTSIPKLVEASTIDLDKALSFLSLPRLIGKHPETGQDISAGIGRYGPYLKYDLNFISIPADETVINIGLNHAVVLIGENSQKLGKVLGDHPDGNGKVLAKSGRFGPYVEYNKIRATLPKSISLEEIDLDKAIELIVAKAAKPQRSKKKQIKKK